MTVVWAIVGMAVGVLLAAQLVWPALNFDTPWLSFGRLRPLHTNAVIFAFGGCALMGSSLYVVQRTCQAYAEGAPETYPAPKPSAKRKSLFIAFAWHENKSGLWLEQRGLDGLWSGLWELPSGQGDTMEEALMNLSEKVSVDSSNALMTVRHILTHRNVEAVIYPLEKLPRSRASRGKRYRSPLEAPISGLARKAIVATQSVL